ncbi:MAG TPA: altronate dehydratase family protein [Candidatus Saccharimonadales bacterium]|nr:altronate dehydratase family protein [Candidatus Saccharimonadales bacterium]
MQNKLLQVDPRDNVLIATLDFHQGETANFAGVSYVLASDVPAKHKFATQALAPGDSVVMYGVLVGKAIVPIARGEAITTRNVRHSASDFHEKDTTYRWSAPDVSVWAKKEFQGFHRPDGRVGTRNYWIVLPLVFCENRNLNVLKQAFEEELGFAAPQIHRQQVAELARLYQQGKTEELRSREFTTSSPGAAPRKVFPNIDGIKFLLHQAGCGGTREDAQNLCGLLAGYINHPNVAGATVLSLGCQHAQVSILREEIARRTPNLQKPLLVYEQQQWPSESAMLSRAIRDTFLGLIEADREVRKPAPLSSLCVGLKCGGSDGFSGITANPAIGHLADIVAASGGTGILSEFPELCGVEQGLINRCDTAKTAERFINLMRDYEARAKAVRATFEMNPSPGNIRDGLITDAMKSAGAAKKGGTSPITAVIDYPETSTKPGLNLQCTPGNDVECVTAQAGAGATVVLFTTGLGTPTGNPITPVVKISTNSALAVRMSDIIDFDAGSIVSGTTTIEQTGDAILELVLRVASGTLRTKAELLAQDDFIPWKRGVSL